MTADEFEQFMREIGPVPEDGMIADVLTGFIRSEIAGYPALSPVPNDDLSPVPELLIRESGGKVRLGTNYYLRTGSGSSRIEEILAEGRFLKLASREILRMSPVFTLSKLPAPDEDFIRYAGGVAVNTAIRSGHFRCDGGVIAPAGNETGSAELSADAENILLRTLYLLYISAGAGACPDQTDDIRKKRTENALKKLSRPVFKLATEKAAAEYTFAEALALSAAGSCLLNF